ncbi:Excinuclease ABC subunit C [Verrucomicrobia bacterium]|nr:Excinuclease ABC subunit C [Verrucomicrobiota bacterium]
MFYAYILQSTSDASQFYRGHSTDLRQRLLDHNAGKCPHTAKYVPWKVKFYAAFETLQLAQQFELSLKSGSGHAFAKRHCGL